MVGAWRGDGADHDGGLGDVFCGAVGGVDVGFFDVVV